MKDLIVDAKAVDLPITANNSLVLDGFESFDMGLHLNEVEGHSFWQSGEVVQYRGFINGMRVYIERAIGRMGFCGKPAYRVGFGDAPGYPAQINQDEAVKLLQEVCHVGMG